MMLECLVIGAGQSGLSCAQQLAARGIDYLVIDAHPRIGDVWRRRPASLQLFTSRQFCQLGDLPMAGEAGGFPGAAEFGDYLEQFAQAKALKVRLRCKVLHLQRRAKAFAATLDDGTELAARTVINATGSNQLACVPALAAGLGESVVQLTAANYHSPADITAPGPVLVVGDGASGRQIAQELSASHDVILATGRKRKLVPNVVLGRDIFWWLSKLGLLQAPTGSAIANIMRRRDPIPAKSVCNENLERSGVRIKPRTEAARGSAVSFADGSAEVVGTVIWCGGYREDLSWIDLARVKTENGQLHHHRGKTGQPGFYVVGRKWLTCRASELVLGIAADAALVAGYVAEQLDKQAAGAASTTGK
jgi:putative flavoprotein involved in K+ transport